MQICSFPPLYSSSTQRTLLFQAIPKLYSPYAARIDNPIGTGFPDLIARGMLAPANITEAKRPISTPYVARLRRRRPERAYWVHMSVWVACFCITRLSSEFRDRIVEEHTKAPTVMPAATDGTEPVRAYPMTPPVAVRPPRTRAIWSRD
jgi:hypothetical protein